MMDRAVILVVCLTGFVGCIVGGVLSQRSDYFFLFLPFSWCFYTDVPKSIDMVLIRLFYFFFSSFHFVVIFRMLLFFYLKSHSLFSFIYCYLHCLLSTNVLVRSSSNLVYVKKRKE